MNRPVLSGTQTIVLSGTADPSYQEPKAALSMSALSKNRAPNFSNQESFGFLLTACIRWGLSNATARSGNVTPMRDANIAVMP